MDLWKFTWWQIKWSFDLYFASHSQHPNCVSKLLASSPSTFTIVVIDILKRLNSFLDTSKILKSVFDTEKFDVYRTRVFVFVSCCCLLLSEIGRKTENFFVTEHFGINISPKPRNIFRKSAVFKFDTRFDWISTKKKSLWFKISQRKVIEITKKWNVLPFHLGIFQHILKINIV